LSEMASEMKKNTCLAGLDFKFGMFWFIWNWVLLPKWSQIRMQVYSQMWRLLVTRKMKRTDAVSRGRGG